MVKYGFDQSPMTPQDINSVFCPSIAARAKFRESSRIFNASLSLDLALEDALSSIGKPWQSQPNAVLHFYEYSVDFIF